MTPQLYFTIGHPKVDYAKMLDWWSRNSYGRHIYIGHGFTEPVQKKRIGPTLRASQSNKIMLRRNPNVQGSIYFSSISFDKIPMVGMTACETIITDIQPYCRQCVG